MAVGEGSYLGRPAAIIAETWLEVDPGPYAVVPVNVSAATGKEAGQLPGLGSGVGVLTLERGLGTRMMLEASAAFTAAGGSSPRAAVETFTTMKTAMIRGVRSIGAKPSDCLKGLNVPSNRALCRRVTSRGRPTFARASGGHRQCGETIDQLGAPQELIRWSRFGANRSL